MTVLATPAPLESAGTASTAMTVSASLDSQVGKWLPWKQGLYRVRVKSPIFPGQVLPLCLHVLVLRDCPCFALRILLSLIGMCPHVGSRLSWYVHEGVQTQRLRCS